MAFMKHFFFLETFQMQIPEYKVLLIGPSLSGKSSIVQGITEGYNDGGHRIINLTNQKMESYKIALYDTACINEPAALQPERYQGTHAIIFMTSYDLDETLPNIRKLWREKVLDQFIDPSSYLSFYAIHKCDIKGTEKAKIPFDAVSKAKEELGVDQIYDISVQQKIGLKILLETIGEKLFERFPPSK
ncbi:hypothetical protein TRFO_22554 [Tritrichomonas foetus]|uniref:Small GTP-binding protein n=1 Tax=Tritrichomonas foetus TaxID=1144522 RepID=A0A1J4KG91_9EUKA|nr:hypothetical protein TRFO_22554 [Tritrichomonas foetus]|eukprot:OHT08804.1 hypothetical protein TRFO_22554 [Tritrichomonas foetus]